MRTLICIALLLLAAPAPATVTEYRLDNGMKLLVKEDHRAPVVVSQVWYRVGGSYEHDGITGISHALEHMMFKGTARHPAGEFSRIIAENGGSQNAFTGTDYTAYFQSMEKSRLEISFELEADRMRNLLLPEAEFLKEIEVVKEERRLRTEDEQEAFTWETAMATAFQTSPYRQPIVGWMADLEAMTAAELGDWYRRWYAPDNAVLVVAGDVEPEAVLALAQKHFGPLKPEQLAPPRARPEVAQAGIKRVQVRRPAEVPYLIMAWKVPALNSLPAEGVEEWEPYALEVLAGLLDGGSSARFATRLVRGSEIAAGVSASYNFNARLDTVFVVEGTPGQGADVARLEAAVRDEIGQLQNTLADAKELERVKAQVVSADVYQRDSVFYQALILGMLETVGLGWRVAEQYVERVRAVSAEQVQAVARKYFIDSGLTVAELVPLPMDPDAPPRRPPPPGGHGSVH